MIAKYIELIATALLFTTLSLYLISNITKNKRRKIFKYSVVFFIIYFYIPVYEGVSIAKLARGFYSDLSMVFICLTIMAYVNKVVYVRNKMFLPKYIALINLIIGIILYLSTFGVINYDIYSHGYALNIYILAFLFIMCIFTYGISRTYSWILLVSIIGYYFELLPSNNIFDYLFDIPLIFLSLLSLLLPKQLDKFDID